MRPGVSETAAIERPQLARAALLQHRLRGHRESPQTTRKTEQADLISYPLADTLAATQPIGATPMADEPRKPHFSASQLDMYCRCPEAYRRRYEEKDIIPPGIAALRGTGMHRGAAHNMRQKIESHRDLPAHEIIDVGVAAFAAEAKGGIILTADEASAGVPALLAATTDDLVAILDVHAKAQAPAYQPIMVEQLVRLDLPAAPRDLLGVIDVATDTGVVDFKTAKRSKSQADLDGSIQLTIYAALYAAEIGRPADFVALDTIVQTKKETKRQLLLGERDEADFRALANRINAVQKGIDAGSFPPAAPGSWNCSAKWCGYHATCPFVNAGRGSQGD